MDEGRGAQRAAGAAGRKVGDTDITAMGRRCTHLIPRYRIDSECLNAENPLNYWINVNNARCDK